MCHFSCPIPLQSDRYLSKDLCSGWAWLFTFLPWQVQASIEGVFEAVRSGRCKGAWKTDQYAGDLIKSRWLLDAKRWRNNQIIPHQRSLRNSWQVNWRSWRWWLIPSKLWRVCGDLQYAQEGSVLLRKRRSIQRQVHSRSYTRRIPKRVVE